MIVGLASQLRCRPWERPGGRPTRVQAAHHRRRPGMRARRAGYGATVDRSDAGSAIGRPSSASTTLSHRPPSRAWQGNWHMPRWFSGQARSKVTTWSTCGADADPFADAVVVVAGHMGQHGLAAAQAQRVQKFRAAKRLAHDLGLDRCVVVMDDVVGAQQHVALARHRRRTAAGTRPCRSARPSAVCTTTSPSTSRIVAGVNTPWPMKSATNRVAGRWYSV